MPISERPLTREEHAAYLARIGLRGARGPSASRLKALHHAHLTTDPFENFNRFLGRKIDLSTGPLFTKLVTERRGGICYELNVGFALLLRAEGFEVEFLSAQVADRKGWRPRFDHLLLHVPVRQRRWLVDVGFGPHPAEPFELGSPRHAQYLRADGTHLVYWEPTDGTWQRQFRLSLEPQPLGRFARRIRWHQVDPDALFVKNWLCSLPGREGPVRLFNEKLRIGKRAQQVKSAAQLQKVLKRYFGLDLPVTKFKPWKLKRGKSGT